MARSTASSPAPEPESAHLDVEEASLKRSFWQRLRRFFRPRRRGARQFQFDDELVVALKTLAEREQRSVQEMAQELLSLALAQRDADEAQLLRWRALTPREQQVAALICLNYTNDQIASRLVISIETVKTHVRNILWKFNLTSKAELRQVMANWDFSAYEEVNL
jgi:DNA-binding CsgD family transcriptional regulator